VLNGPEDIAGAIQRGRLAERDVIELGELLNGSRTLPPRNGPRVFKSVGFAALDILAASAITRAAVSRGRGTRLNIH
jgi:ornithine cyclodeaminase/alanine dehydrogenase-like protein (mu-crystallin family)